MSQSPSQSNVPRDRGQRDDQYIVIRESPPKRNKLFTFIAWFLGLSLTVPLSGFVWSNGGGDYVCMSKLGPFVHAVCPVDIDFVTDEQATAYAKKFTIHLDGGWTISWVYDQDMKPRSDRSVEIEKQMLEDEFGRVDHMVWKTLPKRVGQTNDFSYEVVSWKTTKQYSFEDDKRFRFHKNTVDRYTIVLHLTAGGTGLDQVWGSMPTVTKQAYEAYGTHDAPEFVFTKAGIYYENADETTGLSSPRTHSDHGMEAAICVWAPAESIRDGHFLDMDEVMIRTYVGWIKYNTIKWVVDKHYSVVTSWPKDLKSCDSAQ